jgi:hypothetical protein
LKQLYDGNSTNFAIFDNNGRQIANILVDESIPSDSIFATKINLKAFNKIRKKIISPTTSGLPMAEYINEILKAFAAELQSLDKELLEGDSLSKENRDVGKKMK